VLLLRANSRQHHSTDTCWWNITFNVYTNTKNLCSFIGLTYVFAHILHLFQLLFFVHLRLSADIITHAQGDRLTFVICTGVARECRGCRHSPRSTRNNFSRHYCWYETKMGLNLVRCTPQMREKGSWWQYIIWCIWPCKSVYWLRKVITFLVKKKVHPRRENAGYVYGYMRYVTVYINCCFFVHLMLSADNITHSHGDGLTFAICVI